MIPSEINFAVGDKETALKTEKQKHPEIPSYFFTSTFHSRSFGRTEMGRVSIQPTYNPNFSTQHRNAIKKLTPFAVLKILFFGRIVAL